jgi:hypothetical protein
MDATDFYKWEAEAEDGRLVTRGGSLHGCVRFSLVPQVSGLRRVDIVGVPLRRRFCRAFHKVRFSGGGSSEFHYYHCVETGDSRIWINAATGAILVTPRTYEHYV